MSDLTTRNSNELESRAVQHWSRHEWFYMWTRGLDPRRIALVCRVPYRKVYDHIRSTVMKNPGLFGRRLMLHDRPALPNGGLKKRRSWDQRCAELGAFGRLHGRFPRSYIHAESSLYSFLQYQRRQYRDGSLSASRKAALDELAPGWLTPPKAEREDALWQQRVTELEKFLQENGRYPSYKKAVSPAEKVLAVWLQRQRHCMREGKMALPRQRQLDAAVPEWMSQSA